VVELGSEIRAGPRVKFKSGYLNRSQYQGRVYITRTVSYYLDFQRTAQHWLEPVLAGTSDLSVKIKC